MAKTKTVLLIGNFLSGSVGTRGVAEDLRDQLVGRGWKVLHASERKNRLARLADMLLTVYRMRGEYQAVNVDIFSGASFLWAELVSRLVLMVDKPLNLTLHGGGLAEFAVRNSERTKRLLLSATSVNTPSIFLQKTFLPIRSDIDWIPNGIEVRRYKLRARKFEKPRLIWLRAFHKIYNPEMAVEALSILRSDDRDCTLIMIGPDKHDGTYVASTELARQKQVLDFVEFTGPVHKSAVPAKLDMGDIFLNTTRFESFGVCVVEAAACGLPIVTTNAGELPYLWENGADALLVPSDNPEAMADAVKCLLDEPGLAQKLSMNARKKAERFDWSVVLPQWEVRFQNLIEQKSR